MMSFQSIHDRHGGWRPWSVNLTWRLLLRPIALRRERQVDWRRVQRLVFCCKGNICRSAYAEARARLLGLPTVSFGLQAADSAPANPRAQRVAAARGVDLAGHRTTPPGIHVLTAGDLVLVMEPVQLGPLRGQGPFQLTLMGLWHPTELRPWLQDPYARGDAYFEHCFGYIDEVLERITALAGANAAAAAPAPGDKRRASA